MQEEFTVPQVAKLLNIEQSSLYKKLKNNTIISKRKIKGRRYFTAEDVKNLKIGTLQPTDNIIYVHTTWLILESKMNLKR
jgi:phage antirepressor YoqD-like protein